MAMWEKACWNCHRPRDPHYASSLDHSISPRTLRKGKHKMPKSSRYRAPSSNDSEYSKPWSSQNNASGSITPISDHSFDVIESEQQKLRQEKPENPKFPDKIIIELKRPVIELKQPELRQHSPEPLHRKEGYLYSGAILGSEDEDLLYLRKKPEKSTQYLSKSYDDSSITRSRRKPTPYNDNLFRQRSKSPRLSVIGKSQSKRLDTSTEDFYFYDRRHRTASGSDSEDSSKRGRRRVSTSSTVDDRETKEPTNLNTDTPESCAPDVHFHFSFPLQSRNNLEYKPSSPTFDGMGMKKQIEKDAMKTKKQIENSNHQSEIFAKKKRSSHENQDLGKTVSAEDHKSVLSNKGNAYSKAKVTRAMQKMAAERRIGLFLAQHSGLKLFYEEALRWMDKTRFVDNIQRLLKQYYLDLSQDAKTDADRATSHLLRDGAIRRRIARYIANSFNCEYTEIRAQIWQHMHEMESKISDPNDLIAGNAGSELSQESPKSETSENVSTSDDEACNEEDEQCENKIRKDLSAAVEMEKFLVRGRPFENLCMNLEVLPLPATLSSLTRQLMSVPNDRIWFSTEEDLSISNKIKTFLEEHTEQNWIWWPLQPRMRGLVKNQIRLHWRCVRIHCPILVVDTI